MFNCLQDITSHEMLINEFDECRNICYYDIILTVTLVGRSSWKPPFHQETVAGGLDPAL